MNFCINLSYIISLILTLLSRSRILEVVNKPCASQQAIANSEEEYRGGLNQALAYSL